MRVAVAMSGGVDSTAAALLMRDGGYDVVGVTMLTSGPRREDAVRGAARAAASLGIEHHVIDLGEVFEHEVVVPFARAYAAGRTPNPCVLCNRAIKFGALLDAALELGAESMATGHYARLERGKGYHADRVPEDSPPGGCVAQDRVSGDSGSEGLEPPRLFESSDPSRDQTYFIASVGPEALTRTLFPLGRLTKADVRALLDASGLTHLHGEETRDICFIPGGDMRTFLAKHAPEALEPGPIEDLSGRTLGTHAGLGLYTVGQRTGLGLARPRPTYVLAIDAARRALTVGDEEELAAVGLEANNARWILGEPPTGPRDVSVRIRSASPKVGARIEIEGTRVVAVFAQPARAVAPGQAAVFYEGSEVLGSATITAALS